MKHLRISTWLGILAVMFLGSTAAPASADDQLRASRLINLGNVLDPEAAHLCMRALGPRLIASSPTRTADDSVDTGGLVTKELLSTFNGNRLFVYARLDPDWRGFYVVYGGIDARWYVLERKSAPHHFSLSASDDGDFVVESTSSRSTYTLRAGLHVRFRRDRLPLKALERCVTLRLKKQAAVALPSIDGQTYSLAIERFAKAGERYTQVAEEKGVERAAIEAQIGKVTDALVKERKSASPASPAALAFQRERMQLEAKKRAVTAEKALAESLERQHRKDLSDLQRRRELLMRQQR